MSETYDAFRVPKCTVKDRKVVPCTSLSELIRGSNPSKREVGFFFLDLRNIANGSSRSLVVLKSGEHTQKGLIANFCPVCGERIDGPANSEGAANG